MKNKKKIIIASMVLIAFVVLITVIFGLCQKKESAPVAEQTTSSNKENHVDEETLNLIEKAIVKQAQNEFDDSINFNCEITSSTNKNGEYSIVVSSTMDSKDLTDELLQVGPKNTSYVNLKNSLVKYNKNIKKLVSSYTNVDQSRIQANFRISNSYNLERYLLWYVDDTLVYSVVEEN